MPSVAIFYCYPGCRYAECHCAECCSADCRGEQLVNWFGKLSGHKFGSQEQSS